MAYQPPQNFLSMYFLISSAISCSLERWATAWQITCLASYSVSRFIYEYLTFTPHFYQFLSAPKDIFQKIIKLHLWDGFIIKFRLTMNTSTMRLSKSPPPKSKSPIRENKSRSRTSIPASPKAKKQKTAEQALVQNLKRIREKICATLDACILIFETNAPMRCLEHNSVLSLYCETQQKLICANCIFKNTNHRLHRVLPLEKSYKSIYRDVQQMMRQAERQLLWAESNIESIKHFLQNEERVMKQSILNLAQEFDQLQNQLSNSYEQARKRIVSTMDNMYNRKQELLFELQFYRETVLKNRPLNTSSNYDSPRSTPSESRLIFEHVLGKILLDYGKIEESQLAPNYSVIEEVEKREIQKIGNVRKLIRNIYGEGSVQHSPTGKAMGKTFSR